MPPPTATGLGRFPATIYARGAGRLRAEAKDPTVPVTGPGNPPRPGQARIVRSPWPGIVTLVAVGIATAALAVVIIRDAARRR
jgi:hypothetical protein